MKTKILFFFIIGLFFSSCSVDENVGPVNQTKEVGNVNKTTVLPPDPIEPFNQVLSVTKNWDQQTGWTSSTYTEVGDGGRMAITLESIGELGNVFQGYRVIVLRNYLEVYSNDWVRPPYWEETVHSMNVYSGDIISVRIDFIYTGPQSGYGWCKVRAGYTYLF